MSRVRGWDAVVLCCSSSDTPQLPALGRIPGESEGALRSDFESRASAWQAGYAAETGYADAPGLVGPSPRMIAQALREEVRCQRMRRKIARAKLRCPKRQG
jgi:hypothetical protein